jgi:hypothetical protein
LRVLDRGLKYQKMARIQNAQSAFCIPKSSLFTPLLQGLDFVNRCFDYPAHAPGKMTKEGTNWTALLAK